MDLNQNIRVVIFDFDGTIAKIESDWRGWQEGILKIFQKYEPSFQIDSLENIYKVLNGVFEKYINTNLHKEVVDFSDHWELDHCDKVIPNIQVVEYIKRLFMDGIKIFVWSNNGEEFIKRELGKLEIADSISIICGRNSSYYLKPSAEAFEKRLYDPSIPKQEYLMTGNEDDSDGVAAKAAGIGYVNIKELFE